MSSSLNLRFILLLFYTLNFVTVVAQNKSVQTLRDQWEIVLRQDHYEYNPSNIGLLLRLAVHYKFQFPDSSLIYARQAYRLASLQRSPASQASALLHMAKAHYIKGAFSSSLEASSKVLLICGRTGRQRSQEAAEALNCVGLIYLAQKRYDDAAAEFRKALVINQESRNQRGLTCNYTNLGVCYDQRNLPDSAMFFLDKALVMARRTGNTNALLTVQNRIAEVHYRKGNFRAALEHYESVLGSGQNNWELTFAYSGIAQTYNSMRNHGKAITYASAALDLARKMKVKWEAARSCRILSEAYIGRSDYRNGYKYLRLYKEYDDSMFDEVKEKEINFLHLQQKMVENKQLFNENRHKQEEIRFNNLIITLVGIGGVIMVLAAALLYRSNRKRFLLNRRLEKNNKSIQLQNDKIEQQNKELSRLNYTKDQLFYILGHDLRAPLASVQQAAELLCDGAFSPDEQKIIMEGFYREITLVTNMVNNMLHWALGQQKGIRAEPAVVDLAAIGVDIFCLYEIIARNKGIELLRRTADPVLAYADPDQARVIIRNLVGNAVKFTDSGGTVSLSFEEDDECCKVHIKDTGVGMTEEKISRLFSSVGKSISTYGTKSESGTGLGLMMVKQFVDANRGTIEIRSRHNEGTEVIVSLPKAISAIT
ncbi:ATP-binding protein [Arcticibacter sp. MXS-1]|uniref:tetratricopeptide repeat-containing sensor histidine kinase n=1 Tax=Arcticibacter sp. MXS-1 TaxID=3341726 RepID=UPI0035A8287F